MAIDENKLEALLHSLPLYGLVLIGCAICLCLTCCIICCYKCRTKRKEQKLYVNKTLTQVEFGSVKVMHYADTSTIGDIVLPSTFRTSTRGSTPAPLSAVTSLSNGQESESKSIEHEFSRPMAISDEALIIDDTDIMSKENDIKHENNKTTHTYNSSVSMTLTNLYHEHQKWELCLLHALNSLLQNEKFTHKSLDEICKMLAPNKMINPHKSILQTGNYDANVLMMALGNVNIDVQWYDARKANKLNLNDPLFLEPDKSFKFVGFILNNPQKAILGMFPRRHWIAIRKINGGKTWYNLDSKLDAPQKFKNTKQLTEFLVEVLTTNNAELMICRKKRK